MFIKRDQHVAGQINSPHTHHQLLYKLQDFFQQFHPFTQKGNKHLSLLGLSIHPNHNQRAVLKHMHAKAAPAAWKSNVAYIYSAPLVLPGFRKGGLSW